MTDEGAGIPSRRHPIEMHATALALAEPEIAADTQAAQPETNPGPRLHVAGTETSRGYVEDLRSSQASLFGPTEVARKPSSERTAERTYVAAPARRAAAKQTQEPLIDLDRTTEASFRSSGSWDSAPSSTCTRSLAEGEAPVAFSTHRMLAASIDSGIVFLATAVVLTSSSFVAPGMQTGKATWIVSGLVLLLATVFYRLIFCIGNTDTLGSHWAGVRLLSFRGSAPTRRQRLVRMVSSAISLISIGIGFLWALVDEERLAWHDHISGTFPSPRLF